MYYLGIDLGGTNIAAGIVNDSGKILHKDSVPTHREREYPEIVRDMALLSQKIIRDAGLREKDVKMIGVGTPGTVNNQDGTILYANNLRFHNVPVRAEMQKYVDLPVLIDNDANVAALAESVAGAAKGAQHSVTITLGTGVGGGIVIDRKVYSGYNNAGAELGHMVIIVDGESCTCGRHGCWEAYASATALIGQAKRAADENPDSLLNRLTGGDLEKMDAKIPFDAAKQGDETGKRVVERYIHYIGMGLGNIVNIFFPEIIVIGGGVCKEGDYLLKPLRELVLQETYCREVPQPQIRVAMMGNDAGIVGAAMLGL